MLVALQQVDQRNQTIFAEWQLLSRYSDQDCDERADLVGCYGFNWDLMQSVSQLMISCIKQHRNKKYRSLDEILKLNIKATNDRQAGISSFTEMEKDFHHIKLVKLIQSPIKEVNKEQLENFKLLNRASDQHGSKNNLRALAKKQPLERAPPKCLFLSSRNRTLQKLKKMRGGIGNGNQRKGKLKSKI